MELVRLRAGGTPSLAFVQALYRETEGNPFFIEEIVRHLTDAGVRSQDAGARDLERVGLPEDVRDVISRRLDRLAPGSIEWLRVAAVIGRDFDSALLERVLGFDEDRFLSALEDALDAGLVTEAPGDPGRYSFAHALIRETLYEGMSSARRARVHRRVGVALEESDPSRRARSAPSRCTSRAPPTPRTPSGRSATACAPASRRRRCWPTRRRPRTTRGRWRCSTARTRRRCGGAAICCWSWGRPRCAAASARWRGPPSARRRRWPRSWATRARWLGRRSAPPGATCSRRASSTRSSSRCSSRPPT